MKTIWKFPWSTEDLHNGMLITDMPVGADILYVDAQDNGQGNQDICMWAQVETTEATTKRIFVVSGTGHPIPENSRYVGTVQLLEGKLVLHVWEIIDIKASVTAPASVN